MRRRQRLLQPLQPSSPAALASGFLPFIDLHHRRRVRRKPQPTIGRSRRSWEALKSPNPSEAQNEGEDGWLKPYTAR